MTPSFYFHQTSIDYHSSSNFLSFFFLCKSAQKNSVSDLSISLYMTGLLSRNFLWIHMARARWLYQVSGFRTNVMAHMYKDDVHNLPVIVKPDKFLPPLATPLPSLANKKKLHNNFAHTEKKRTKVEKQTYIQVERDKKCNCRFVTRLI